MKRRKYFFLLLLYAFLLKRANDISRIRKQMHARSLESSSPAVRKRSRRTICPTTLNYARELERLRYERNTHFRETSQFAAIQYRPIVEGGREKSRGKPICVVLGFARLLTFRGNDEIRSKFFNSRWSSCGKEKTRQ